MRQKILSHGLAILVGAGLCLMFDNQVHQVKEEIVYKDKIRTVVKEVIRENPDGSKTIERISDKTEDKNTTVNKVTQKPAKNDWLIGVKYDLFQPMPVWTAEVQRRIIGNVYVGAYGRTDGVAGVSLTVAF